MADAPLNELEIARAMAAGDMPSPQRLDNVHLWAMRITGTGAAYRTTGEEFVWRDKSIYLNDDFLARCNGLALVFEHPPNMLDSEEFAARNVGACFLPYIKGDEVWGVFKVYDDDINELMKTVQVSTSPGLRLAPGSSKNVSLDGGEKLLIEGEVFLLDHLAICEQGVWDKGGAPVGVDASGIGDQSMTEEEREAEEKAKADAARKDAEEKEAAEKSDAAAKRDARIDAFMDACMDRFAKEDAAKADAAKKDETEDEKAEREKADKAKSDADAKEKEEAEKADAAKRDADIKAKVDEIAAKIEDRSDEENEEMADAQMKADSIGRALGVKITGPMSGESGLAYRRRLAAKFKDYSPTWKAVDLAKMDSTAFAIAEDQIRTDAMTAARSPIVNQPGTLRLVERQDDTGRKIKEFYGDPDVWMAQFKGNMRAARFRGNRSEKAN